MAVMAPSVLLRERDSSARSEVATGSFTGAAACGPAAPAAEDWPICALPEPGMAQTNTANRNAEHIRFIRYLLNDFIRLRCLPLVSGTRLRHRSETRGCKLPEQIPSRNHRNRRAPLHLAGAGESNAHQHDSPYGDQIQRRGKGINKLARCGLVEDMGKIGGDGIIYIEALWVHTGVKRDRAQYRTYNAGKAGIKNDRIRRFERNVGAGSKPESYPQHHRRDREEDRDRHRGSIGQVTNECACDTKLLLLLVGWKFIELIGPRALRHRVLTDLLESDLPIDGVDKDEREDGDQQPRRPPARVAPQIGESF